MRKHEALFPECLKANRNKRNDIIGYKNQKRPENYPAQIESENEDEDDITAEEELQQFHRIPQWFESDHFHHGGKPSDPLNIEALISNHKQN